MVSVIIATYNYGRFISEAIESLINQTYVDWECIIIDDGSTDNTKSVVDDWIKKDKRITYFSQQNAGPTSARNNGISKAKGEYILFLDADDLLQPNKLKSHIEIFESQKSVDIAYGDARYFYGDDNTQLFFSLKEDNKPWIPKYNGNGAGLVDLILRQNMMVISSPVIRRKVFDIVGNFDPKLLKLEDWELFQRMAISNFVFHYVEAKDAFVLIRAHASSLSYDKRGMRNYLLPILEKHFAKSKLSVKNRMYVFFRMIEEYTDLAIASIAASHYPPRHYYQIHNFLLPLLSLCCLPFYFVIKIFRFIRKSFQHD